MIQDLELRDMLQVMEVLHDEKIWHEKRHSADDDGADDCCGFGAGLGRGRARGNASLF